MPITDTLEFGPFCLEIANETVWRQDTRLHMPPRLFGLLCYFVHHPQQLLTKDRLFDSVWGHRFVSESALKARITELRKLLGDSAKAPRFIETVCGRGYRFVAKVRSGTHTERSREVASASEEGAVQHVSKQWRAGDQALGLHTQHRLIERAVAGLPAIEFPCCNQRVKRRRSSLIR
jgi:DNA-binding winged helix-turn-helix (wHTH) protein